MTDCTSLLVAEPFHFKFPQRTLRWEPSASLNVCSLIYHFELHLTSHYLTTTHLHYLKRAVPNHISFQLPYTGSWHKSIISHPCKMLLLYFPIFLFINPRDSEMYFFPKMIQSNYSNLEFIIIFIFPLNSLHSYFIFLYSNL